MNGHYRQTLNFTFDALAAARASLSRIDAFTARLAETAAGAAPAETAPEFATSALEAFSASIAEDLNMPNALAALFRLVRDGNAAIDAKSASAADCAAIVEVLRKMDTVLSLIFFGKKSGGNDIPEEVAALLDARAAARKAKAWAESDRIRDELKALGWEVKDTPQGQKVSKL